MKYYLYFPDASLLRYWQRIKKLTALRYIDSAFWTGKKNQPHYFSVGEIYSGYVLRWPIMDIWDSTNFEKATPTSGRCATSAPESHGSGAFYNYNQLFLPDYARGHEGSNESNHSNASSQRGSFEHMNLLTATFLLLDSAFVPVYWLSVRLRWGNIDLSLLLPISMYYRSFCRMLSHQKKTMKHPNNKYLYHYKFIAGLRSKINFEVPR